jgi:hypothetical protein
MIRDVTVKKETTQRGYEYNKYTADFHIQTSILSKYYSGQAVKNADYTYKVYKQYYYDDSYWNDCYYGCYFEPRKEFYSE